jgi:hypothetical protein
VEVVGTSLLTTLLLAEGIEVARPIRDRGIDLLAYLDLGYFRAVPIQVKAYSEARFGIDRKYEKFPELRIVHLWNVQGPRASQVFCTTFSQAFDIAEELGWTATQSWQNGTYSTAIKPGTAGAQRVAEVLSRFEVTPGGWLDPLFGLEAAVEHPDERFDPGVEDSCVLLEGPASYRFELNGDVFHAGRTGRVLVDPAARILWVRQDTFDGEPFVPELGTEERYMFRSHQYLSLIATPTGFEASRDTPGERLVIEREP